MIATFQQGLIIGLAVSIPVGPIALLIMRRSLLDGRLAGFVSGLGAATADVICGTIVALGITAVTSTMEHHRSVLQFCGGLFLLGFGFKLLRTRAPLKDSKRPVHERNLPTAYLTTCLLTLANPLTFVGMAFVTAAAGVGNEVLTHTEAGVLVAGVFTGSCTWWSALSGGAGWLGKKLGSKTLDVINRAASLCIIAFGCWQLIAVVRRWL